MFVSGGGGAVGRLHSPTASAEIEGEESEVVSIDTPTVPQHNLIALLQEVAPLPPGLCSAQSKQIMKKIEFCPIFISIDEEEPCNSNSMNEHIRDLLNEYQQEHGDLKSPGTLNELNDEGNSGVALEKYEQSAPIHGDRMFHYFISKIQMNPGQVLRYSRGNPNPLLIGPVTELPNRCKYCKGGMVFEMQILPTLIPKLKLASFGNTSNTAHLEFGNIMIFTCDNSCWNNDGGGREEAILLQSERY